jgi:hypothetical protein
MAHPGQNTEGALTVDRRPSTVDRRPGGMDLTGSF